MVIELIILVAMKSVNIAEILKTVFLNVYGTCPTIYESGYVGNKCIIQIHFFICSVTVNCTLPSFYTYFN